MSLEIMLFGKDSFLGKVSNIGGLGVPGLLWGAMTGPDPKIAPQRLGELARQSAKEGQPRPIIYGIGRPVGGNVMYQGQPITRMVKTYAGKAGGKGGGKKKKQYQDVEHVYRYYAIRVCEGPITGFRRIWRNGALVYDARAGSAWGAANNHLFFNDFKLYTGSWGQMPDPDLQSHQKEMDIPAYRGTAYLVAANEDLTQLGGAIPQWMFEVVRSEGYYATSRPYAIEQLDGVGGSYNVRVDLKEPPKGISAAGLTDITFKASLINTVEYGEYRHPVEAVGLTDITFKASLINTVEYGEYRHPVEAVGLTDITFKASLNTIVIDVSVPPEAAAGTYNVEVRLD
jgi:hypothetical protein